MKMQSPVFKKQGESVTKISSLFIFSMICHSVICYLMPIEIKKKSLNYWHELYHSLFYCAIPDLNANIRALNWNAESLKYTICMW